MNVLTWFGYIEKTCGVVEFAFRGIEIDGSVRRGRVAGEAVEPGVRLREVDDEAGGDGDVGSYVNDGEVEIGDWVFDHRLD